MDFDGDDGSVIVGQIQTNIQKLAQQVQVLEGEISKLSESSHEGERLREQFNEQAHVAHRLSKETNQLMRQLVDRANNNRSLRVHRERLSNEYMGVLNRLQQAQRRAAQTEKDSVQQMRHAAEQDGDSARAQQQQQAADEWGERQRHAQQRVHVEQIKERTQAIQQLERDIGDVNQIFSDLARIVHDQGEMVDSIEANVEHATIHVEQGATNVQQAVYYNQKARQKKMLLCVFLAILVFIILLTVYLGAK